MHETGLEIAHFLGCYSPGPREHDQQSHGYLKPAMGQRLSSECLRQRHAGGQVAPHSLCTIKKNHSGLS